MTEEGEDILANVISYFIGSVPTAEDGAIPSYNIFIILGVTSLTALLILKDKLKKRS